MISCYIESYTYQQKQRPTDSLACRNSTTSMLTLDASERLYQPISLFTYFYLHAVQNSFIYNTDYQLSHKPILIWRSTHITELKITLVLTTCYSLLMCMLIKLVNYTKYNIVFMNALNVTGSNVTNIRIEFNTNSNITLIQ